MTTKQEAQRVEYRIKGLPELACILGAIYLAANNMDGWGWLLLIAVMI